MAINYELYLQVAAPEVVWRFTTTPVEGMPGGHSAALSSAIMMQIWLARSLAIRVHPDMEEWDFLGKL